MSLAAPYTTVSAYIPHNPESNTSGFHSESTDAHFQRIGTSKPFTIVEMQQSCNADFHTISKQFLSAVAPNVDASYVLKHDYLLENHHMPYSLDYVSTTTGNAFIAFIGPFESDSTEHYCKQRNIPMTENRIYIENNGTAHYEYPSSQH